ncbi:DoxX family protein [Variovorax sp. YR216]|uniref:DoxX family protein n=1 Tax=Variovorax sp. YR216 TaxID=1882828 RepID=UPI000895D51E|nr:DoxX family protein [Variovorax sp. YR216]SEB26296.1 putative oxidoreductase [Variovorax sp. YR216]
MSNSITATAGRSDAGALPAADVFALIGRLLVAYLFIPAGFAKLTGFSGIVGYITSVGMPMPTVAAAVAIIVELGAGIALLLGFKTRIAAIVLAVFTLVASFYFHAYWAAPGAMKMVATLLFNKNIAVVGGLLALAAFGPGRLSIDKK